MDEQIRVGKTYYMVPLGNALYYGFKPQAVTVSKLGMKYFYVKPERGSCGSELRFNLEDKQYSPTSRDDCNASYRLFESEQDYVRHKNATEKKVQIIRYVHNRSSEQIPDSVANDIYSILVIAGEIKHE